jgi:hypothetical protein
VCYLDVKLVPAHQINSGPDVVRVMSILLCTSPPLGATTLHEELITTVRIYVVVTVHILKQREGILGRRTTGSAAILYEEMHLAVYEIEAGFRYGDATVV